jgi:hypothetical protein
VQCGREIPTFRRNLLLSFSGYKTIYFYILKMKATDLPLFRRNLVSPTSEQKRDYSFTSKMEATSSSETFVIFCHTAQRHILP